jgi:hypothetical protein
MLKMRAILLVCGALLISMLVFEQAGLAADVETVGDLKVSGMIDNTGGEGIKFPDGNIQTSACSGCAGGILSISLGGTGASNATTALANLGGVNKTGDTMTGTLNLPANGLAVGTNQLVTSNGRVGIGKSTPTETLDVVGNIRLNKKEILLADGTDVNHGLGWYGSGKAFASETPDGPVLYGYLGGALGTTAGGQKVLMKWHWSDGFDFNGYVKVHTLSGGSTSACLDDYNTISNCSSDARMKKDVITLSENMDVLEALAKLRGVMFTWDRTNEKAARMGSGRDMGMIAQEVETVFPEIIHTDKDGYKSMDYPKLVAFLVEVNKAQQAQLAAQKEDIGRLTLLMEELSARVAAVEGNR